MSIRGMINDLVWAVPEYEAFTDGVDPAMVRELRKAMKFLGMDAVEVYCAPDDDPDYEVETLVLCSRKPTKQELKVIAAAVKIKRDM